MSDICKYLREWAEQEFHDAANEIERLRERLAEADEANRRVSDENETLRRDVRTAIMGDSAELQDVKRENEKLKEELNCWHEAANWPEKSPHALRAENEKLREALKPFAEKYQDNGLTHSMYMFEMKTLLTAKKVLEA